MPNILSEDHIIHLSLKTLKQQGHEIAALRMLSDNNHFNLRIW
jgi:hypothetical protein